MARYYRKEIPEIPVYLPIGKPLLFDAQDRDYGYLKTNDGYIIGEIAKLIATGKGGIEETTEEAFEEFLKKKASSTQQQVLPERRRTTIGPRKRESVLRPGDAVGNHNPQNGIAMLGVNKAGQPVSAVAQGQKSDGLKVERTFVKPKVGKLN